MHSTASFLRTIAIGGVFTAVPLSVLAQVDNPSDWNHFGLDFRMGFNIQAKFTGAGVLAAPVAPAAPSAGSANRTYSDGFVNVDSSVWLDEIVRYRRREILDRLQHSFGRKMIQKISFRVG